MSQHSRTQLMSYTTNLSKHQLSGSYKCGDDAASDALMWRRVVLLAAASR